MVSQQLHTSNQVTGPSRPRQPQVQPAAFPAAQHASLQTPAQLCRAFGATERQHRHRLLYVKALSSNGNSISPPWVVPDARLVLADGSVWHGKSFGYTEGGMQVGEVVFNTTLTGYQELLTDPSYRGQFVCYTCTHIGNVGINAEDVESERVHLTGIIVRDLSCVVSNYRSKYTLDEYLKAQKVPGIANLDTRAITRRLRETGAMNGVIAIGDGQSDEELVKLANEWTIEGKDLLSEVTCSEPYEWKQQTDGEWEFSQAAKERLAKDPFHVVAYDFGIKQNILRRLASFGCKLTVVPANYPAEKALALKPDGVFFSNGPGDPSAAPYAVNIAKEIIGKVPTFGICMGHQIMGQAFGASTFKLKFGHHGGNHPIRFGETGAETELQGATRINPFFRLLLWCGEWYKSEARLSFGLGFGARQAVVSIVVKCTVKSSKDYSDNKTRIAACKTDKQARGRIEISAQNHNYAVDPEQLPSDVEVTHINLNDGTCAGMLCRPRKAMSIQYHPEASPGPHDADVCFEQFINLMEAEKSAVAA